MTLTEALILARDDGFWIRSKAEGVAFPTRWIRRVAGQVMALSYVWSDRSSRENRSFCSVRMAEIDHLLGEWEAIPDPQGKPTKQGGRVEEG